jgi:hypothetical protein
MKGCGGGGLGRAMRNINMSHPVCVELKCIKNERDRSSHRIMYIQEQY